MDAKEFIEALHGGGMGEGLSCCIWSAATKRAEFCGSPDEAATCAATSICDVYVSAGLFRNQPSQGRGGADDVAAISGLWLDLDVAAWRAGATSKIYPPDEPAAMSIIGKMGLPPSLIVRSGGGLQAWWLLREPWIFRDDADRIAAARLAKSWVSTAQEIARASGWTLDSVGDLARIMRIAGTMNGKYDPPRLTVAAHYPAARYDPDHLEQCVISEEFAGDRPTGMVSVSPVEINTAAQAPHALQLALEDSKFRRTWERKRTDMSDQSASSYDLAIANEGAYRGWTDQQTADAIVAWRSKHGENPSKISRRKYLTRTIGLAKSGRQADEALEDIATAGGPDVASNGTHRSKALDTLSRAFQRRVVRWLRLDGEKPLYSIALGDPDIEILIGGPGAVMNFSQFAAILYGHGVLLDRKLAKKWPQILGLLLTIAETQECPEAQAAVRVRDWIIRYLDGRHVHEGAEWARCLRRCEPCIHMGGLHVHATSLRQFLEMALGVKFGGGAASIYNDLRVAGFQPHVVGDGRTTRNYWFIPCDDAAPFLTEGLLKGGSRQT